MISLASSPAVTSNKPVRRRLKRQGGTAALEGPLVILPPMATGFAMLDYSLDIFNADLTTPTAKPTITIAYYDKMTLAAASTRGFV